MNIEYRPRFSFEISEKQKIRADQLLETYGLRKAIFEIILDDILDLIDDYGGLAIGAILSRKIKPREIIPSMNNINKLNKLE